MELRYDFSDPTAKKAENNLLSYTLKTMKGSCLTMPLLYLAVAQELGWPIYPVIVQNHMFLRYAVPGGAQLNIEATSGTSMPDDWYIKRFNVSPSAISNGSYMRTTTYKELLGVLLQFNTTYYFKRMKLNESFDYINTAIELFPKDPNLVMLKASMLRDEWTRHQQKGWLDVADMFWQDAKYLADQGRAMGYKDHDDSEYVKTMKEYEAQEKLKHTLKPMN